MNNLLLRIRSSLIASVSLFFIFSFSVRADDIHSITAYSPKHHCLNLALGYNGVVKDTYIDPGESFSLSYTYAAKSALTVNLIGGLTHLRRKGFVVIPHQPGYWSENKTYMLYFAPAVGFGDDYHRTFKTRFLIGPAYYLLIEKDKQGYEVVGTVYESTDYSSGFGLFLGIAASMQISERLQVGISVFSNFPKFEHQDDLAHLLPFATVGFLL